MAIQKRYKIDLPEQAFESGLPSLAKVRNVYGDEFMNAYVELWIIDFCDFVNIGKGMKPAQIYQTASLILEEFYYFNLAEINLVFKRAKKGFYGEIFDRLDGQIILKWFREYNKERCAKAEEISINEASGFTDRAERLGEREAKKIDEIGIKHLRK